MLRSTNSSSSSRRERNAGRSISIAMYPVMSRALTVKLM